MIKVVVSYHNEDIKLIKVSGHAKYDEHGNDLVCAGVSSIVFGLMNALDDNKVIIKEKDNFISIKVNEEDLKNQHYLELCIIQLRTIEEVYNQYLQVDIRKE